MARTTCTTKKIFGKKSPQRPLKRLRAMRSQPRSTGGRAPRRDTLQAEDMESPLTTPPSSPIPVEGDSVMDSETVAQHSRLSYTHNRVSDIIFIAYFVEVFFGSSFAVFVRMVEQFIAAAGAEGWCARFASSCPKDTRTLS